MAETLYRLLYRSEALLPGGITEARRLVEGMARASADSNAVLGVTGCLMFVAGQFFQLLEGQRHHVETLFERICCDLRHTHVQLIEYVPVEHRMFGSWGMIPIVIDADRLTDEDPDLMALAQMPSAAMITQIMLRRTRPGLSLAA